MSAVISVVVPVYKVEKYLDVCVKSLLNQTFTDFELILVDDGSPDQCPQMCDDWALRDERISVIHKANGGLADARNVGIRKATGKYVAFVDSDDWVETDFLKILFDGIVAGDYDMVQCNFRKVYEDGSEYPYIFPPAVYDRTKIQREIMPAMLNERLIQISSSRCNKLYKLEIVKKAVQLCDSTISMAEDYLLNFACMVFCDSVCCLNTRFLYHYRANAKSMTAAYKSRNKYEKICFYQNMNDIAVRYNVCEIPDVEEKVQTRWMYYIYECAISNWANEDKKREIREITEKLDRKLWWTVIWKYDTAAKKICQLLTYCGMTDLMLVLTDVMKRIKGIE